MQIETVKKRLEVSGFQLDDDAIAEIGPWMRWSTSFCALFTILGTWLAAPWLLWALALTALAGSVLPHHPFDYAYNHGVRRITKTGRSRQTRLLASLLAVSPRLGSSAQVLRSSWAPRPSAMCWAVYSLRSPYW